MVITLHKFKPAAYQAALITSAATATYIQVFRGVEDFLVVDLAQPMLEAATQQYPLCSTLGNIPEVFPFLPVLLQDNNLLCICDKNATSINSGIPIS